MLSQKIKNKAKLIIKNRFYPIVIKIVREQSLEMKFLIIKLI